MSLLKSNREDLDGHLDEVEEGLNHLRDLFKGDQHHMDGNTLIGLGTPNKPFFNLAAIDPDTYKQVNTTQHNSLCIYRVLKNQMHSYSGPSRIN